MSSLPSSATAEPVNALPSNPARTEERTARGAFGAMTSLFFFWGFMTVFNDVLIPRFKHAFELSYFQAMLVQSAFFGAYFVGALGYFLISAGWGDPIAKLGYKNGVVGGLLLSALGSLLFWPAASAASYPMFLGALFVVGLGFALLQIAANPYVTVLGPERTAASRLNLAQGFNSVGTTLGPLIGGWLIFHYFADDGAHGAESVKMPYLLFALVFIALAGVFYFLRLPAVGQGQVEPGIGVLKRRHVVLGVVAIFMYVGGEVAVGSAIINFLADPAIAGLTELQASKFVSLYWGGLLIGRFMGAVQLSELSARRKRLLLAVIPLVACLLLWIVQSAPLDALRGESASLFATWGRNLESGAAMLLHYLPFVALCWALFQFGPSRPERALALFSAAVVVLLAVAMLVGGRTAMWCIVAVGLFTSIGWSNIFSLAIDGLGAYKSQASSLHRHDAAGQLRLLAEADGIFVGGGETFVLLGELQRTGQLPLIRERVRAGVPYGGSSAGANVAGLLIGTTNDFPVAEIVSREALAVFPGVINPHHPTPDAESDFRGRAGKIAIYLRFNPTETVLGLANASLARLHEGRVTLVAGRGWIYRADGSRALQAGDAVPEISPKP